MMETPYESLTRQDFIRHKHREIFRKYLELLKQEQTENPMRAEHIGKLYYARIIAQGMTPPMAPKYIQKVINNCLREGDSRS